MNDYLQAKNAELLKNKQVKINPIKINISVIKTTGKKFSPNVLKKKIINTNNESSSYDELHYGNYE
jgi:hypothetical protein